MTQAVENRSDVTGRVEAVTGHPTLPGFVVVQLQVTDVAPVAGYASLFDWACGQEIAVNLPAGRAAELHLAPGDQITARVRMSGPHAVFADPETVGRC